MATYSELVQASNNAALGEKINVACFIAAEKIRVEAPATTNHTNRMVWAKSVYSNPGQAGRMMVWAVLAQNAAATLVQITGASDATVQTAVDAAVDVFANGV